MNKEDIKIILDAGHGGADPGTSGNGIVEKDLALQITLYMYERLKELGIPVKITRTTDETISPAERVNRVLNAWGNDPNVILISNHLNASGNKGADGAEVIYALRNTDELPNMILQELQKEGQNIRSSYQRRLPSNPSKDYYFMQRNTDPIQSLTIEYGFLDSNKDDPIQLKNNYRRYVDAVVRALMEYLNIKEPITEDIYIVKKGDTLYKIANQFGVSVEELKSMNNLTSNTLQIGQQLKIKDNPYETYVVQKGDSLWKIANNYGIKVEELKNTNNLENNLLKIGQELLIPKVGNKYIVQKGDSLWKIAFENDTTVDEIKRKNNLVGNLLTIGQELFL